MSNIFYRSRLAQKMKFSRLPPPLYKTYCRPESMRVSQTTADLTWKNSFDGQTEREKKCNQNILSTLKISGYIIIIIQLFNILNFKKYYHIEMLLYHKFKVDHAFIPDNFYLEVAKVDNGRHFLFATTGRIGDPGKSDTLVYGWDI